MTNFCFNKSGPFPFITELAFVKHDEKERNKQINPTIKNSESSQLWSMDLLWREITYTL